MLDVGWIGLGAMGAPMSACVARAGHQVTAYDIDPARAVALADEGIAAAATVVGAAAGRHVVVLMVATPAQGEAVLFGNEDSTDGGAARALGRDTVLLVMSTVGPAAVTSWADRLVPLGVDVVDAPVSGGVTRAGTGDLLILVGGSAAARERVQPLLDAMASSAPVVGEAPGDGQRMKLVNQLLCGVHIAVAGEALAFAGALGLDPQRCWEILDKGAAASFMFHDRGERMGAGTFTEVRSALDIFVKDMGLVVDAAGEAGSPAPLAAAAQELYRAGHDAGFGRLDDSSIIQVFRG